MNLWLRMIGVLIASFFKPRMTADNTLSRLDLRVWPNDLDINMHVNNGRYLTYCDLSRVDIFIRTGLARLMMKKGWVPVVAEHTMIYKKSLGPFQKFRLETEISHWDDKFVHMVHRFTVGERVVAEGTSKGGVRSRDGVVPPAEILRLLAM